MFHRATPPGYQPLGDDAYSDGDDDAHPNDGRHPQQHARGGATASALGGGREGGGGRRSDDDFGIPPTLPSSVASSQYMAAASSLAAQEQLGSAFAAGAGAGAGGRRQGDEANTHWTKKSGNAKTAAALEMQPLSAMHSNAHPSDSVHIAMGEASSRYGQQQQQLATAMGRQGGRRVGFENDDRFNANNGNDDDDDDNEDDYAETDDHGEHRSGGNNEGSWADADSSSQWYAVQDLDQFFHDIYKYHEGKGFRNIVLARILKLFVLAFTVCFAVFLIACVDYDEIFETHELGEAIHLGRLSSLHPILILSLVVSSTFWLFQFMLIFRNMRSLLDMRTFYVDELQIPESEIETVRWNEVLRKLEQVQRKRNICIVKKEITPQDVANRIMRKDNYLVALMNKDLLNLRVNIPFLGPRIILPKALEWNIARCILDYVFDKRYGTMKEHFLDAKHAERLAKGLRKRFFFMAVVNLLFAPFIMVFMLTYFFFRYTEEFRNRPTTVGARQWTPYARWWLREFNELPHIFQARLNNGYKPASKYISKFNSEFLALIARFIAFVLGAFAAIIIAVSIYNEDFLLQVHLVEGRSMFWVLGVLIAILGVVRTLIPDENLVFDPPLLMRNVVYHIHMFPAHWKNREHTFEVAGEFSTLFDMRMVVFAQEVFSFILTPAMLFFKLPSTSRQIIDFIRQVTVYENGVGYVCSFALFNFERNGNANYGVPLSDRAASQPVGARQISSHGKMEKSFLSFKATNADWKPRKSARHYLDHLTQIALDNPMAQSATSTPRIRFQTNSVMIPVNMSQSRPAAPVSDTTGLPRVFIPAQQPTTTVAAAAAAAPPAASSEVSPYPQHAMEDLLHSPTLRSQPPPFELSSSSAAAPKSSDDTPSPPAIVEPPVSENDGPLREPTVAAAPPTLSAHPLQHSTAAVRHPMQRSRMQQSRMAGSIAGAYDNPLYASRIAGGVKRKSPADENGFIDFLSESDMDSLHLSTTAVYDNLGLSALLLERIYDNGF
ncbi:hypothetical protein CAOG_01880 [Capsaspora owczarzaki ATCC 30864]|uniref:Autophagy-related protein 9 n=1 Tax=Capsaspora owczarzaki (strain ATCC 30864) TaxID=595528 RepID=A0A0D2X1C8_CAPO3|nr:hypothetical protein CAOG_01880 [Capsaspora owczarzaki ATCC 30864]KJE90584.1 hypothetical protein CAOG_001880 [Capsaspora owczarzaki ATCC 30864]|eukprot:XP_004364748.1 hypothetical protein CAOG_01880 [Capsaspora owczarzaki ATCC 30864]